jgi:hypothetical protein
MWRARFSPSPNLARIEPAYRALVGTYGLGDRGDSNPFTIFDIYLIMVYTMIYIT